MAGLTVQQLQSFNPGGFTSAASAFETASQATNSSQSSLQAAAGSMGDWAGPAADAANNTMSSMLDALTPTPPLLEGAQQVLESFVTAVSMAQEKLSSSVRQAQSLHCTVAPDGTVTPPPQPAGEPPQVCFANPQQEAARVKAQNAYDQSPQVQGWDNAVKQAPALQSAIQGALHDASAADSRASGDLSRTSGGAKDFTLVAGGNTGAPLTDLTGDQLSVQADGAKWSQYFASKAATLARKAATNPNAAKQLQQDYGNLARTDAAFSTAVLNQLGAKGMEQLVTREGYYQIRDNAASAPAIPPGQDPLLQFLSNSLATGTAQIDDPVAQVDGNSVGSDYLQQLVSASNANEAPPGAPEVEGKSNVPGWWALGQILAASSQKGQTPYGTTFLTTVGPAMVQWDKDKNGEGKQPDVGPQGDDGNTTFFTDPLVGLLTAAKTNPTGDQQLLTWPMSGVAGPKGGTAPQDVLTYLISDHHWSADTFNSSQIPGDSIVYNDIGGGSDHGAALGQAIQAATGVGLPGGSKLAVQAFDTYGQTLQAEPDRAGDLSGLQNPMAHVLVQNYGTVENTVLYGHAPAADGSSTGIPTLPNGTDPGTVGDPRALAYTIAEISKDPKAYQGLQSAALVSAAGQTQTSHWGGSLQALGFVVRSHDVAIVSRGATEDANALHQAEEVRSQVSSGIDAIPLPENVGPAGDLSKALVGQIWEHVAPLPPANAHGDAARDLASADSSALHSYTDAAYPGGAEGTPAAHNSGDALIYVNAGAGQAGDMLNKLYTGVLPSY